MGAVDNDSVQLAVALGWQVAELFHTPVHRGGAVYPKRAERLPGRSDFPGATQSKLLGEQITAAVEILSPKDSRPKELADALVRLKSNLEQAGRGREATLNSIFDLHCRILETLSVADYRLGKAYGLGRALAETTFIDASPTAAPIVASMQELLHAGRLGTITDWLFDLKTLLPAHTAYAISRTIDDWRTWVLADHPDDEWPAARERLRVQGRIWRTLITGEKSAQDMLKLADYMTAAQDISKRVWKALLPYRWWFGGAILFVAGSIIGISFLNDVPPSVRVVTNLAWLAAVLGVSLKGVGSLMGGALKDVSGWLWQAELDEAVAAATACLPTGARHGRAAPDKVGELLPAIAA